MFKVASSERLGRVQDGGEGSPIDEIVREGARAMLAAALRAEVAAYIEAHAHEVDEDGRRLVVRNGYAEPREVLTSSGAIEVVAPRVNDRRVEQATGARCRFSSGSAWLSSRETDHRQPAGGRPGLVRGKGWARRTEPAQARAYSSPSSSTAVTWTTATPELLGTSISTSGCARRLTTQAGSRGAPFAQPTTSQSSPSRSDRAG